MIDYFLTQIKHTTIEPWIFPMLLFLLFIGSMIWLDCKRMVAFAWHDDVAALLVKVVVWRMACWVELSWKYCLLSDVYGTNCNWPLNSLISLLFSWIFWWRIWIGGLRIMLSRRYKTLVFSATTKIQVWSSTHQFRPWDTGRQDRDN